MRRLFREDIFTNEELYRIAIADDEQYACQPKPLPDEGIEKYTIVFCKSDFRPGTGWYRFYHVDYPYEEWRLRHKPKGTLGKVYELCGMNTGQQRVYDELIFQKYKEAGRAIYYVVNNKEEFEKACKLLEYRYRRLHDYPLSVGREPDGFMFQSEKTDLEPYLNHKNKTYYKYQERSLNDVLTNS